MAYAFNNDKTKASVYTKAELDLLGLLPRSEAAETYLTITDAANTYHPLLSASPESWEDELEPDTHPDWTSANPATSRAIKALTDALAARITAIEEWMPEDDELPVADYVVAEGEAPTSHTEKLDFDVSGASTFYNIENVTWHYQKWSSGKFTASATQETKWLPHVGWGSLWRGYTIARQELPFLEVEGVKRYFLIGAPTVCNIDIIGFDASCITVKGHYDWMTRDLSDRTTTVDGVTVNGPKPGESTYKFFPVIENDSDEDQDFLVTYYIEGRWK